MTFQGGAYFLNEIQNRIAGRWQPLQILPYLNESLGVIYASGSYNWDQVEELGVTPTTAKYVPTITGGMDSGKKMTVLNSASKTPISKVPQEEYAIAAAGYVDQTTLEYNAFKISYTAGVGAYFQLYPLTVNGVIDVYYHLLPPVLTVGGSPTVRWDIPFMDSVLLDMTEAACKRLLATVGWQDREAAARSKLMEAVKIYSTDRINTGSAQETTNAVQEKTQIGRA